MEHRFEPAAVDDGGVRARAFDNQVVGNVEVACFLQSGMGLFGPGTTTRAIFEEIGLEKTLLGVDVILNKELVSSCDNSAIIFFSPRKPSPES